MAKFENCDSAYECLIQDMEGRIEHTDTAARYRRMLGMNRAEWKEMKATKYLPRHFFLNLLERRKLPDSVADRFWPR